MGLIPLRIAVLAPGQTDAEGEEGWLAAVLTDRRFATDSVRKRAPPEPRADLSGADLRDIEAARELARIYMGRPAEDDEADRYILRQWRRRDIAATKAEARRRPRPPEPLPPWCGADDPATALVGRWAEPATIEEGLEKLREVQAVRRRRVLETGALYRRVVDEELWRDAGFRSLGEMLRTYDLEPRTLQRAAALVRSLEMLPDTTEAVVTGEISLDEARRIGTIASDEDEGDWLELARWYTAPDFARLVELASRGVPVVPVALGVLDALVERTTPRDYVTFSGIGRQMPPRRHQSVPRDLLEAARWFLQHGRPEPERGIGRARERDRRMCRNPECRRPGLDLHVHHEQWRSKGGTDDDANLLPHCFPCHLRGQHGGAFRSETVDGVRVWTYADGRRVFEWLGPLAAA
jgi:hypothetical protein